MVSDHIIAAATPPDPPLSRLRAGPCEWSGDGSTTSRVEDLRTMTRLLALRVVQLVARQG